MAFILSLITTVPEDRPEVSTETLCKAVGENTGNLAFETAVTRHLGPDAPRMSWSTPADQINALKATGVFPAANQLGRHADYGWAATRFARYQVPLAVVGLGAQASTAGELDIVPDGTIRWLREVAKRSATGAPNIAVRGPFTLKVLEHYGLADKAVALGCPSLFLSPQIDLGRQIEANRRPFRRVAVVAGNQYLPRLKVLEASLADIVEATEGSYVVQHPREMVMLGRGDLASITYEGLVRLRNVIRPKVRMDAFPDWCRRFGRVFFDVPSWMEHYRGFDLVVGTRIHGAMLALQAGVPALCITHDSRTRELCEVMGVPHIDAEQHLEGLTLAGIEDLFAFDGAAFDDNRRRLAAAYTGFLRANMIEPQPYLDAIAV